MEETTATTETEAPAATPALEAAPGHPAPVPAAAHGEHGHPGPAKYVAIAMILAFVTAVEVGLYYIDMPDLLLVAMLLGLAFIKFSMVVAYFMHLKFDSRLLRRLFVTGLALAIAVYTVALVTMDVLLG